MNWQIIVGVILLIGGIGSITSDFSVFLFGLAAGGGLLYWGLRKKGFFGAKVTNQYQSNGFVVAYRYDHVKFYPPTDIVSKINIARLHPGTELTLVPEPENTYDHAAIALYWKKKKIGYLLKNKIQDMANDYLAQNWPVKATISSLKLQFGDYQGYINLTFFRPGKQ